MPDLPERPDLDQLRRRARELLRAAAAGEPEALARLLAVSERPTLAAAQLAIAREHGLRSWPALRSEVESRRQSTDRPLRADAGRPAARDIALGRWSFGGAGTVEVEEGELTLGILIAGPEGASLEASLAVAETVAGTRQSRHWFPELRDVTVTDDQGSTSTVGPGSGHAGPQPWPAQRADRTAVTAARAAIQADHPAAQALMPLAALLSISPFRLSRAFSNEMGVSLTRYRNHVRLKRVLDRLEEGEDNLAVLAADLQFADQAHLCRTVRQHLGHTPTALRRLLNCSPSD